MYLVASITLNYTSQHNNGCRDAAEVQDSYMTYEVYKDEITMRLVAEACKLLGRL